ncbi:nicotinate phosphoribosyltransferase [Lentilactobacillus parabuchneri]|nr:nicotinate phosphoribosyltransferase [Lentilactobacillus parabuchneri]
MVYRLYYPGTQNAFADVIALADESLDQPITVVKANPLATQREQRIEKFDAVPLQVQALDGPKLQTTLPGVFDIQKYSQQMLTQIPAATKRLINPDEFPVYVTTKLAALQESLVEDAAENE